MFSNVNVGQEINTNEINIISKNIYETNFFEDVSVKFSKNVLSIN